MGEQSLLDGQTVDTRWVIIYVWLPPHQLQCTVGFQECLPIALHCQELGLTETAVAGRDVVPIRPMFLAYQSEYKILLQYDLELNFDLDTICNTLYMPSKHADWCDALYASSRSKDDSLSTLLLFLPESNIIMMVLIKYNLYQYYLSTS